MKKLLPLKLVLSLIFIASIISCGSDDDDAVENDTSLVGIWQRSDFGETNAEGEMHDYRFHFTADLTGYRSHDIVFEDGTGIGATSTFTWSTNNNSITIDFDVNNQNFSSPYSFNSEGQLVLSGLTDLPFNSIEE